MNGITGWLGTSSRPLCMVMVSPAVETVMNGFLRTDRDECDRQ
jgi:hypothetical protein